MTTFIPPKETGEVSRILWRLPVLLLSVALLLFLGNASLGYTFMRSQPSGHPPPVQWPMAEGYRREGKLSTQLHRLLVEEGLAGRRAGRGREREREGGREERLKVTVVNSASRHNEIVFWLVYTLRLVPDLDLTAYNNWTKHGARQFVEKMDRPKRFKIRAIDDFEEEVSAESDNPDVLFLATCGNELANIGATLRMLLKFNPNLRLICINHHSELILNNTKPLLPFAKAKALTFVSLAPHIADFVKSNIIPKLVKTSPQFAHVPSLHAPLTFIYEPMFPCPRDMSEIYPAAFPKGTSCFSDFAIQEKVELHRRNCTRVLQGLNEKLKKQPQEWQTFHLNLLGVSKPNTTLPKLVGKKLRFFKGLDYKEFYGRLHHNAALLPAFRLGAPYLNVSPYTAAVSLIAGVPFIADEKFLKTHNIFQEDDVYLQEEGETVADTIERIRRLSMAEVVEKKRRLAALNLRLILKNVHQFRSLIREGAVDNTTLAVQRR